MAASIKKFNKKPVFDEGEEATYSTPKKVSDDYSKTLKSISDADFSFDSNLELLKKMRRVLLENLKVCDGAYKAKPTQGNIYALTNLVNQVQMITERIEEAVDYNEVVENVIKDVVNPFIEKIILALGNVISTEIDSRPQEERKILRKTVNTIFKKYAAEIETKIPELGDSMTKNIINQVK